MRVTMTKRRPKTTMLKREFFLPSELLDRALKLADIEADGSFSQIVRVALRQYVESKDRPNT